LGYSVVKSFKLQEVLALEAERTLILDIEETIKAADQANIAIIGL